MVINEDDLVDDNEAVNEWLNGGAAGTYTVTTLPATASPATTHALTMDSMRRAIEMLRTGDSAGVSDALRYITQEKKVPTTTREELISKIGKLSDVWEYYSTRKIRYVLRSKFNDTNLSKENYVRNIVFNELFEGSNPENIAGYLIANRIVNL